MSGTVMMDLIGAAQSTGPYFSPVKILVMFLLMIPWMILAPWVQKDAKKVRASQTGWPVAVLLVAAGTTFIWLVQPYYVIGLLTYVLLTGGVLVAYITHRNSRVNSEEDKVLTVSHLKGLFSGQKPKTITVLRKLRLYHASGKAAIPPTATSSEEEQQAYNACQELLYDIVFRRASEADLSPASGGQTRVRFVIDGVVQDRPPLPLPLTEAIIQYLKGLGGMEVEDRRRPQGGQMAVDLAGMQIEIGLRSAGTTGGQRMQFRVIQEFVQTRLDGLGMDEGTLARVKEINGAGSGLIIVSGRSGSGVTSTLYSLLREHDAFVHQLESVEARPAVDLENITQHTYGDAKDKVASVVAAVLRRDPNVLMVDECPDTATAELLANTAADKTILLSLSASDTFTALAKWVKLCGDAQLAAGPLQAVLCQMLLRKLCPNCREPYVPNPEMLAKANLSGQGIERFYRPPTKPLTDEKGNPIGCVACQGTGYLGRTAVFELLEVTDEIRQMIVSGAPVAQIKAVCRKNRMLYLQEQALQRVIGGVTSVQELIRVSQMERKY
ncbi:MAG: Flp pilus assembly complex ATPase component TadA [Phycisphaerae bacterium]|nr:Flp pilus assembly complex ATPase component TadA [Phycisphaerae bacterium]